MEKKELRKENAFAKEYFPKLNELYASGNDEEVYTYINSLYNLDGSTALYRWKHMDYYNYYTLYMDVKFLNDAIADNSYNEYDISTDSILPWFLPEKNFLRITKQTDRCRTCQIGHIYSGVRLSVAGTFSSDF